MQRDLPSVRYPAINVAADVPKAFHDLCEQVLVQHLHSSLVMPDAVWVLEQSFTTYHKQLPDRAVGFDATQLEPNPDYFEKSARVWRRTYTKFTRSHNLTEYLLVSARAYHERPVQQRVDFDNVQAYLWAADRWVFLFEWDTQANTWAFEENGLTVADPLDSGTSNYDPTL